MPPDHQQQPANSRLGAQRRPLAAPARPVVARRRCRTGRILEHYFHAKNQNFKRSPNSLLVEAVKGRRPGSALDVGMGEGRNAIYLAKQGWHVTGIDRAEGALPSPANTPISRASRSPPFSNPPRNSTGATTAGIGRHALRQRRARKRGKDPRVANARRTGGDRGVPAAARRART